MYSELELVNHILATLGEDTTPTLSTNHPAVVNARSVLSSYNKEFQSAGWWFNRETDLKLLPEDDGRVRIPTEALSFRITKCLLDTRMPSQRERFVKRGTWVYDNLNHTYIINAAVWADIILLLPYEDLPSQAASYLKHWAAEQAFLSDDGDIAVKRELGVNTAKAWALLKQEELKAIGVNAFNRPAAQNLIYSPGFTTDNPLYPGGIKTY